MNLNDFEATLTGMSIRSKAFKMVKAEMIKRGYWKNLNRGTNRPKQALQASRFTPLSMNGRIEQQGKHNSDSFSEGL